MSLTNRFFIYAPFALFVILATGLSVRWFWEAEAFSKRLDAMNGEEIAPGVTLHFVSKTIAGFPFRLDAIFKNVEIDVATPHGPSSWHTHDFALHRLTYGADKTLFEAAGSQVLSWTSLDGRPHFLPFAVGAMQASAVDGDDGIHRFDLVIAAFSSPGLDAQAIQIHARRAPDADAVDVSVAGDGMRFHTSLGMMDRVAFAARATPGTALSALRAGRMDWPHALAALAQANGALDVQQVEFAHDRFDATGKGSLSLDANARPQGALDFKIAHLQSVLTGVGSKGFAKALADRAAKVGSDDMGRIGIVIGAKDGILYAGDEPVGTLTPVY
jgi:hypothetical protein